MLRRRVFTQAGEAAEAIYAFEHDQIADSVLNQHVAIEASECIRSQSVLEQMVPADALIQNAHVPCSRRSLEPRSQHIRPTVISICSCAVAVRDRIAQNGKCRSIA